MIKLTTYAVVAMGVLSSTSYAQSGLDAIYDDPTYDWNYYIEDGVNDINSSEINDIRLFKVGNQYWTTIYADKTDANSAYTAIFKSNISDGIDGIFAVSRNSGYRWGVNKILANLEEELGSKYFIHTPITDGEGHEWSWEYDWGLRAADWLESTYEDDFTFENINIDARQYSNSEDAYAIYGGVGSYIDNSYARVYGTQYVIDPNSKTHTITYNQTVYEDGTSYGYISANEIRSMVSKVANELTESAFEAGWSEGYSQGYNDGWNDGFEFGYNEGFSDAIDALKP